MALTRNFLKSMGLTEEQVSAIIENHAETVEALKQERDGWKTKADSVDTLTRERDDALDKLSKAGDAEKVQREFDAYKERTEKAALNARKTEALSSVFEEAGVKRDIFRRSMLRSWDMDTVEIDDDGKLKDVDGIKAAVQRDFSDYISTEKDAPIPPHNPPTGNPQTYTREDIRKMSLDEINKHWAEIQRSLPNIK